MRRIERSAAFKKDYKKLSRSINDLEKILVPILKDLVQDKPLAERLRDHALSRGWVSPKKPIPFDCPKYVIPAFLP